MSELPRASTISWKPPVVPRPSMGGAPKAATMASRESLRQRSCSSLAMLSASKPWPRRLEYSSNMIYSEPRFGALAPKISDVPGNAHRVGDAVAFSARWPRFAAMTFSVRGSEADSGNCTLRIR